MRALGSRTYVPALIACASVLALTLALQSCGGGEETLAAGTLTKQQFLKKATVICTQGNEEAQKFDDAAWQRYQPDRITRNKAVLDKIALALLPAREREARRLRALGFPKGDERFIDAMITALEEGIEEAREDPEIMYGPGAHDHFGLNRSYRMRAKYGLEGC